MFKLVEYPRVSEKCEENLAYQETNVVEIVQGDKFGEYIHVRELGDYIGYCIASFRTMRMFKKWMKGLQVELGELADYHNYNGKRYFRFNLKQKIVSEHFWHPHDLVFGVGDRYIWHQGRSTTDLQSFFAPVVSNGSVVNGFIQKRGDDRIIYRCNPNSSFYVPYDNLTFEEELARYWRNEEPRF